MTNDKLIISAYGSHNASISLYYKGLFSVIEVERWTNIKNAGLTFYMPSKNPQIVFDEITSYLLKQTDRKDVDIYLTEYVSNIVPKFHFKQQLPYDHHMAHAAGTFYQSPYKKALIFTFDGGGDGSYFNTYIGDRHSGIKKVASFNQDLGFPYMVICDYLSDIKKEPLSIGNLVYAGKVMGLCSYGKVIEEWLPFFDDFYDQFNYYGNSYIGGAEARYEALTKLFNSLGCSDFGFETSRYKGEFAWNIAATSQAAFERQFFKYAEKFLEEYKDLPVCMSGGCALNVLLNTKLLKMRNNQVYVPPNTNDCGISVGGLLWYLKPETQVDLTYSGTPVLDADNFAQYIQEHDLIVHENTTISELAHYLSGNYLVGIVNGNSEHGSRALGNRSILCNPVSGMKEKLNDKVKHREWYRPFAPMVRLEDTPKYFVFDENVESRHMVFVAEVREEWRSVLPAITHNDNTGRLQTVTRSQNEFIYDLLTNFESITGHGVLLNTSFNVNGKPILSRLSDALDILRKTELDAVYYNKNLIFRNDGSYAKFKKYVEPSEEKGTPLTDDTTVYLISFPQTQEEKDDDVELMKKLFTIDKKFVIITADTNIDYYERFADFTSNVKYYFISNTRLYYSTLVNKRIKDIKFTPNDYSKWIKMLWCKEVLKDNLFNSSYHLFVNLDKFRSGKYNYDIVRDISLLADFAKDEKNVLILKDAKAESSLFTQDELKNKYPTYVSSGMPSSALICGHIENLNWLFSNWEGVFLWYFNQNKCGNEDEYFLISSIENNSKYKFIGM
jgi:carbamoyltransferase